MFQLSYVISLFSYRTYSLRFSPFLGTLKVTSGKATKKDPKRVLIFFKICTSPFYSHMGLSTN